MYVCMTNVMYETISHKGVQPYSHTQKDPK